MKRTLVVTILSAVVVPLALASQKQLPDETKAVSIGISPLPTLTASENWKTHKFGSTKLGVQTHAPADETLQPFYDRMSKALLRAALTPYAAVDATTPELDELIKNMQGSSKDFSDSQTCAVLKDAEVSSLGDTRKLLQNLIGQYEGMRDAVMPHLVWTCEVARALHGAINHGQTKISKCRETLKTKQPEEVVIQTNAFIVQAEEDMSRLKNMLLCVIGVGHSMYPNVHTEASTISTLVSTFSWLSRVASSQAASPEVTLKTVVGVDQVPAELELVMPDPTKDRAYHEFLQRMLGYESWVRNEAFKQGRLKWVMATQPTTETVQTSATTPVESKQENAPSSAEEPKHAATTTSDLPQSSSNPQLEPEKKDDLLLVTEENKQQPYGRRKRRN